MATDVLDEKIAFQAQRVAAAFGVEEWEKRAAGYDTLIVFRGHLEEYFVEWCFNEESGKIRDIGIGVEGQQRSLFERFPSRYAISVNGVTDHFLARGLYCLGLPDAVLDQLPPLSAHEKMEARLSLAREYWPETWKEEAV